MTRLIAYVASAMKSDPNYRICARCVMDTTDPDISFNAEGICSHCSRYDETVHAWNLPKLVSENKLQQTLDQIKAEGQTRDFDCLIGMSGGVDSSYIAWLAWKNGLRPLCVHLDNGWNSELAVANIHRIVKTARFDLFTHVIDWEEFRDIQRSFFKADVIDLELPTDHAIFGVILQLAKKHDIKYILSGANISTEAVMPKAWVHRKQDLANIRSIQKKFGARRLRTFPQVSTVSHVWGMFVQGYKVLKPLNMMDYRKQDAKAQLIKDFGWRDYGGKHYESVFTKFYQAYILPTKFHVDKRRAHLSTLILSGQMSREEALKELSVPLYSDAEFSADREYVCKKLGFSEEDFTDYLRRPQKSHLEYGSDQFVYNLMATGREIFKIK